MKKKLATFGLSVLTGVITAANLACAMEGMDILRTLLFGPKTYKTTVQLNYAKPEEKTEEPTKEKEETENA